MRYSRDPAFGFIIVITLIILYYGKIESFLEGVLPIKIPQIWIKLISHVIVCILIVLFSVLYYKFTKNPSIGIIAAAIGIGLIVRFLLNEISKMFFNENYD